MILGRAARKNLRYYSSGINSLYVLRINTTANGNVKKIIPVEKTGINSNAIANKKHLSINLVP